MLYDHAASAIAEHFAALEEAEQKISQARNAPSAVKQAAQDNAMPLRMALVTACPSVAIRHAETSRQLGRDGLHQLRQTWQARARRPIEFPDDVQAWFDHTFAPGAHLDLALLPVGAFAIDFTFILDRPYLSRDDVGLYPNDNPVRKEKIFALPMVSPSTWKGILRAAIRHRHGWADDDPRLAALFGAAAGRQGRLHFYPTYFTPSQGPGDSQVAFEVLAPHDRLQGSGKKGISPITLESVPAGSRGVFVLLYVPFDQLGAPHTSVLAESAQHLADLALGLQALFTRYGFGAKTSSGFGRAAPALPIPGAVTLRQSNGVDQLHTFSRFDQLVAATTPATPVPQP